MDYEKKYNEALDRARNLMAMYPQDAPGYKEVFPELAESEDERMMGRIIDGFKNFSRSASKWNNIPVEEVITWLEKQKEQKPAEWSEEDEKMLNDCIMALSNWRDAVANYGHEVAPCQKLIDWLKSLRPSWKPSEVHLSALLAIFNDPDNLGSQTCQLALTDLYEQLKKL